MTATSDERREVARKIREYVNAYGDKIEDAEMVLLGTVWCRGEFNEVVRPTSEAELLAMVADLIDPTCEVADCGNQDRHLLTTACLSCHASAYRATAAGMRACMTCRMRADRDGDEMR